MPTVSVTIVMPGDLSAGLRAITDTITLQWDLEDNDERERVRGIIAGAWGELYDVGGVVVHFGDECADCHAVGYHRPACPVQSEAVDADGAV